METLDKNSISALIDKVDAPRSLLENDLYFWSMGQFVLHRYPGCIIRKEFRCRSDVKLGFLKPVIDAKLDELCTLRYTDDELAYLRTLGWLSDDFVDYLRRFYLFREQVHTEVAEDGQLKMWAEGPWRDVIWFETPCLAIVEEAWCQYNMLQVQGTLGPDIMGDARKRLETKVAAYNQLNDRRPFTISEFGMRRRFSRAWQDEVAGYLAAGCEPYVGTSNVYLAKKYGVKPMGTMAHELYMGLQGCKIQLREVQKATWEQWMQEYRGKNGILLSDIFGFNACLRDMDWYVANSFQGCRHDSGDPFVWGEKLIEHYQELGIDPATKVGCWSDCLNPDKAMDIAEQFSGRIKVAFGIGTDFVADTLVKPVSIVMKMTYSNGTPVLKLSDSEGKGMCPDPALVEYAKHVYDYKPL